MPGQRVIATIGQPAAALPRHRAGWRPLAAALLASASLAAPAAQEGADENAVKAAFIYNFAKFTDWPEDVWNRSTRLRICTTGGGELAHAVSALENKPPVRGKAVEVRAVARADDGSGCHILVFGGRNATVPPGIASAPVLTVGDADGFAAGGGIIGMYIEGDKVRFEANPDAAQRAGIKLSSQILKLARIVRDARSGR